MLLLAGKFKVKLGLPQQSTTEVLLKFILVSSKDILQINIFPLIAQNLSLLKNTSRQKVHLTWSAGDYLRLQMKVADVSQ